MRKRFLAMLAVLALALGAGFVAGCGDDDDDGDTGGGGDGQNLTAGTDVPYAPFESGPSPSEYEGFDIDLVSEIAKRTGDTVTYQDAVFDVIFRDLAQGKFDLVIAASTITPQREQTVDFSDPYYEANQALLVPPGSDIASTDDLAGTTVGAQDGTTGEDYANDETSADSVRGYPTGPDAINAARTGQVDAVILDEPVAAKAVESEGGVELVETITTNELYAIAFSQDADDLRESWNSALQEIKDDGTLADLYEKWFPGTEPPDSVLNGTNDQLK